MELLYPLPAPGSAAETGGSVTVLVNRVVPRAGEEAFTAVLQELLRDFDHFPGTAGSRLFRRPVGGGVEFSILQQFASQSHHDAWLVSPELARWRSEVAPPVPMPDHVHRYSGMESFFVSAKAPDAPPRWKMAVLLLLVVYPLSLAISTWGGPMLASLPVLAGTLITSVFMVWLMTYVLVPILTKVFQFWLQPERLPKN
jgi:antibiotic biosynthesis monooxygenase (ABM) superfamily enzyme